MVPTKPIEEKKQKYNQWKEEDIIDMNDVHENLTKTNVKKELINCCTTGIENKRAIEMLSDRKANKFRKVIIITTIVILRCAISTSSDLRSDVIEF